MSEADTIREAISKSWWNDGDAGAAKRQAARDALTALERRAEQAERHLAKHCGGGLRCPHGGAHSVIGQHRPGDGQ